MTTLGKEVAPASGRSGIAVPTVVVNPVLLPEAPPDAPATPRAGAAMDPFLPDGSATRWLLLVLGVGLVLRLWNLDYPPWKYPDEQNLVDRALLLGHAGPNPRWFAYPSLFLYVLFAADGALYAGGRLLGAFASPAAFAAFYFAHPTVLHLVARGITVLCGLGCLVVTYRIGREGWGPGVGLAAAAMLAVSPLSLSLSRLAKSDMLMALLLLVAAWAVLRSLDAERFLWLGVAALAVGLAASAKYPAGLGVLWLLAAPWLRRRGRAAIREGALALALAGLGFVAGTPFALLDWPTFLDDFANMVALLGGSWYGAEDRLGYTFYLFGTFPSALGWPGTLLGLAGCGRWLAGGRPREAMLAGFAAAFYGWMGYSRVANDHYVLPLVPILALAGADLLRALTASVRVAHPSRWPWIAGGLAALCLAQPLARGLRDTLLLAARDTREVAGAWMAGHLAPGTRILSEPYGPFLPVAAGRLDELLAERERQGRGRGMRLRFERARALPGGGFWYAEMPLYAHEYLSRPAVDAYDLDRALDQGYTVVVLSSAVYDRYRRTPQRYPVQNAFFRRVTEGGPPLARIEPSTPWCCPQTMNARLSEAAARAWGRPGPTLLIYRLPGGGR